MAVRIACIALAPVLLWMLVTISLWIPNPLSAAALVLDVQIAAVLACVAVAVRPTAGGIRIAYIVLGALAAALSVSRLLEAPTYFDGELLLYLLLPATLLAMLKRSG